MKTKNALINGLFWFVGVVAFEVIGLMTGYFTLDETSTTGPIAGDKYIPFPNWLYFVAPVVVGLLVFLWSLRKDQSES